VVVKSPIASGKNRREIPVPHFFGGVGKHRLSWMEV